MKKISLLFTLLCVNINLFAQQQEISLREVTLSLPDTVYKGRLRETILEFWELLDNNELEGDFRKERSYFSPVSPFVNCSGNIGPAGNRSINFPFGYFPENDLLVLGRDGTQIKIFRLYNRTIVGVSSNVSTFTGVRQNLSLFYDYRNNEFLDITNDIFTELNFKNNYPSWFSDYFGKSDKFGILTFSPIKNTLYFSKQDMEWDYLGDSYSESDAALFLLLDSTHVYGREYFWREYELTKDGFKPLGVLHHRQLAPTFDWQKQIAKRENLTVKDYFSLLTQEQVYKDFPVLESKMDRDKLINTLDAKNGYLEFGKQGQCVLFKDRKRKQDIIAIEQIPSISGYLEFPFLNGFFSFNKERQAWQLEPVFPYKKVFGALCQKIEDNYVEYRLKLPQHGTTIIAYVEDNPDVFVEVQWDGEKFVLPIEK
ncbi:hypothetical protein [Persicobacter psychrovividus]|uniref:6-bladed beta-propeller n=1 Tax=Persicobacter psychrovividus TaxID=387638 RepID=A0ABM7VJV1_9BACT|nr:hypothetical protein PEPS_35580 [Persicobacter psychrovividus]